MYFVSKYIAAKFTRLLSRIARDIDAEVKSAEAKKRRSLKRREFN
jgi:hypothetical protein